MRFHGDGCGSGPSPAEGVLLHRRLPDGVEADIIATIKKTFNFSQSDAIHLFQTLMECMKSKELVCWSGPVLPAAATLAEVLKGGQTCRRSRAQWQRGELLQLL